jgi:hypothetical protein
VLDHPGARFEADRVGWASACLPFLRAQFKTRQAEAYPTQSKPNPRRLACRTCPAIPFETCATGNALRTSYIKLLFTRAISGLGLAYHTVQKTFRILAVSLALIALMVFATGVVSDWNHQGSTDDAHCPYCHLGHQTPAHLVAAPSVSMLKPVASLPLPLDAVLATGPVFSQTSPRAPPTA